MMSKQVRPVISLLEIDIPSETTGVMDTLEFPADLAKWIKMMRKSMKESECCMLALDTLGRGCGGCTFTLGPADSEPRNLRDKQAFRFVLGYEAMVELQKAINFCVATMEKEE